MIKRKIQEKIKSFYKSNEKNALLISGARQVGKTYIIRETLKSLDADFVELNFIDNKDAKEIFRSLKNSDEFILRLSSIINHKLTPNKTVIFLDEIQEVKEIATYIKFLVDKTNFKYILSGSMLGIELSNIVSQPIGYLNLLTMYPLDFEEFVLANGISEEIIEYAKSRYKSLSKIDDIVNDKLLHLFRLYTLIGGMPAVVDSYNKLNDINAINDIQTNIMNLYRNDIVKYVNKEQIYIKEIFDSIPSELNNKNKRYNFVDINKNFKFEREKNNFLWLKDAGVAYPCYITNELKVPLVLSKATNLFKLYFLDTGLLTSTFDKILQKKIINNEVDINFGCLYENAVAQNLVAHGYNLFYYNNKKRGEVDFVLENGDELDIAEIKSGKTYARHSAITNIVADKINGIDKAYVYANCNIKKEGSIIYLPIYLITFLEK